MVKTITQIIIFMIIGIIIAVPVTWVLDSSTFTFSLLFSAVQNIVKVFASLVTNALKFSFIDVFIKILLSFLIFKGILYLLFEIVPSAAGRAWKNRVSKEVKRDYNKSKLQDKYNKKYAKLVNKQGSKKFAKVIKQQSKALKRTKIDKWK